MRKRKRERAGRGRRDGGGQRVSERERRRRRRRRGGVVGPVEIDTQTKREKGRKIKKSAEKLQNFVFLFTT